MRVRHTVGGQPVRGSLAQPAVFRIPVADQVYELSEEEQLSAAAAAAAAAAYGDAVCAECREAGDDGLLLLCDSCDGAAHTYCVGLGRRVPVGSWHCRACRASEEPAQSCVGVHDDGDDGESKIGASDNSDADYSPAAAEGSGNSEEEVEEESEAGDGDLMPLSTIAASLQSAAGKRRRARSRARVAAALPPARRCRLRSARGTQTAGSRGLARESVAAVAGSALRRSWPAAATSVADDLGWRSRGAAAVARTVGQQRRLQQRVQSLRDNWQLIRNGILDFRAAETAAAASAAAPRWRGGCSSRASPAAAGSTSRPAARTVAAAATASSRAGRTAACGEDDDVARAWATLDRARATLSAGAVGAALNWVAKSPDRLQQPPAVDVHIANLGIALTQDAMEAT
eukprot:SM000241S08532  [mRNA]  locus=s241:5910:8003:- [translate_table: standard]